MSSEFCEIRTVEARRRRPLDLESESSSLWVSGGVIGVEGESEPLESDSDEFKPLKVKSVTERDCTPRGSSGIGLSGWEVEETGISWNVPLRGRPKPIVAVGMALTAWTMEGEVVRIREDMRRVRDTQHIPIRSAKSTEGRRYRGSELPQRWSRGMVEMERTEVFGDTVRF